LTGTRTAGRPGPSTRPFSPSLNSMPKEYSRAVRVGEQIRRELAVLIQQEIKDPRIGMVTVSEVRVSPDLSHAKVFVTILGEDGDSVKVLNRAGHFLRHELARRMVLRITPSLQFVHDDTPERGARLSSLIDASVAADKDKARNQ